MGERFEISKLENGYLLKDITPPELEKAIFYYQMMHLDDIQKRKLDKHPEYEEVDIGYPLVFDGVDNEGLFAWDADDGNTCTNGVVNKLYLKQDMGDFILNVQLFDPPYDFINLEEFRDSSFSIKTTNGEEYLFTLENNEHYFEGRKVLSVYSLYEINKIKLLSSSNEFNVSNKLVPKKPLLIVTDYPQNKRLKYSFINSRMSDIEKV